MAYVYASLLGTTVLRHEAVPPRPERFDGRVRVGFASGFLHRAVVRELERTACGLLPLVLEAQLQSPQSAMGFLANVASLRQS